MSNFWNKMNIEEKKQYLKKHPKSKKKIIDLFLDEKAKIGQIVPSSQSIKLPREQINEGIILRKHGRKYKYLIIRREGLIIACEKYMNKNDKEFYIKKDKSVKTNNITKINYSELSCEEKALINYEESKNVIINYGSDIDCEFLNKYSRREVKKALKYLNKIQHPKYTISF